MRRALPLLVAAYLVALTAQPASAHTWQSYYTAGTNARWSESNDHQIRIYNHENTYGSFLNRVLDGAKGWERLDGNGDFNFTYQGVGTYPLNCDATTNRSMVWRGPIDGPGGALAMTQLCLYDASTIASFNMEFDKDENWHTGQDAPASDQIDVWSVAAHEFGRSHGFWESFRSWQTVCPQSNHVHTMCESYFIGSPYPNDGKWMRNPNTHDIDTFAAAY